MRVENKLKVGRTRRLCARIIEQPCAGKPHAGICEGGASGNWRSCLNVKKYMNYEKYIIVDCATYGSKNLYYPDSMAEQVNGRLLLTTLEEKWDEYWSLVIKTTSEMAEQVIGVYDFQASFETHDFQMKVYDSKGWDSADYLKLWIQFIDSDSETIVPIFDTTFEKLEVVHCQPVF